MSKDNFHNQVEAIYKLIGLSFEKTDFYAFDVDDKLEGYLFMNGNRLICLYSVGELLPSASSDLIRSMLKYCAPDKNGLLSIICLLDGEFVGLWGSVSIDEPVQKAIDLFMYTLEESEKWHRSIQSDSSYYDEYSINHKADTASTSTDTKDKKLPKNTSFRGFA